MKKIFCVLIAVTILLCIPVSCGEEDTPASKISAAMLYVGDSNKQGFYILLDGTTLDYQTKTALSTENFDAKKAFIETFGKEDAKFEVDKDTMNTFYNNLYNITKDWEDVYGDETKAFEQYWFVELYYTDGTFKNIHGYDAWPENYSEYIKITQALSGKLFPEKIDSYMPAESSSTPE